MLRGRGKRAAGMPGGDVQASVLGWPGSPEMSQPPKVENHLRPTYICIQWMESLSLLYWRGPGKWGSRDTPRGKFGEIHILGRTDTGQPTWLRGSQRLVHGTGWEYVGVWMLCLGSPTTSGVSKKKVVIPEGCLALGEKGVLL